MKLIPYLNFAGNCREAMEFYATLLNAEIDFMQTYGESQIADQIPPEHQNAVLHASLKGDGFSLMASDAMPGTECKAGSSHVALVVDSVEEAERVYAALSDSATITMPLEETFFSKRFGMLIDRFGTPWMIDVADETFERTSPDSAVGAA